KDVKFSDGTPLNADAVIKSIERYQAKYAFQALTLIGNQTKMKKVDDATVEFSVAAPWATFPAMLAGGPGMIVAPKAYANEDKFTPIGAGAFTLKDYAPAEALILSANKNYWGGEPNLDTLRFVWVGADDAKLESMDSGEVDAAFVRQPIS